MNNEQALQIIKGVLDTSMARGGIFQNIEQTRAAILAFEVISNFVESSQQVKVAERIPSVNPVKE